MANVKKAMTTVRYASKKDIPALLELDLDHGEGIWTEEELERAIEKDQATVVLVVVHEKKVAGMLVYELEEKRFSVVYLAAVNNRLDLFGSKLINEMLTDFRVMRGLKVIWYVRESDLDFQVYLRDEFGFRCTRVVRGWFRDFNPGEGEVAEAAYRFKYKEKA